MLEVGAILQLRVEVSYVSPRTWMLRSLWIVLHARLRLERCLVDTACFEPSREREQMRVVTVVTVKREGFIQSR
jgi:hypothetical protein